MDQTMYACKNCNKKFKETKHLDQHVRDKHQITQSSSPASQRFALGQTERKDLNLNYQEGNTEVVTATKKTRSVSERSIPKEKNNTESLLAAAPKPAIHPHMPNLASILGSASDKNPSTTAADLIRCEAFNSIDALTVKAYFDSNSNSAATLDRGVALADRYNADSFPEAMLLGHQQIADGELLSNPIINCVTVTYRVALPYVARMRNPNPIIGMIFLFPAVCPAGILFCTARNFFLMNIR